MHFAQTSDGQNDLFLSEQLMLDLAAQYCDSLLLESIRHHLSSGGKRLRARLALIALKALGGNAHLGPGWAAACELLHNATLVHDDLQDGDTHRRGLPTVWSRFGKAEAINTGDFMLMLSTVCLRRIPATDDIRWLLAECLGKSAVTTVRGQALELELPARLDQADLKVHYIKCVNEKTASLFELPVKGAALLAGYSLQEAEWLAAEFRPLGTLFQMQDDVLDLYGEKGREKRGGDIREGKVSSLVVEHVKMYPSDIPDLMRALKTERSQMTDADVGYWIRRFDESGSLDVTLDEILSLCHQIRFSTVLEKQSALHRVAIELIDLVLKPIEHVIKRRTPPQEESAPYDA